MFAVFKGTNAEGQSTGPDAHESLDKAHGIAQVGGAGKNTGEVPAPGSGDLQRFVLRGSAFGHWLSCKDVSWASVSEPGSGQRVHLALCGEIENEAEIAELYSIPRAEGTQDSSVLSQHGNAGEDGETPSFYTYSSSGAKLLLDLYWKGFSDAYGDYSAQPETCLASLEGCWSFCLFDESSGYILIAASSQSSPGTTLFWASCPATGDLSVTTAGIVDLLDRSTVSEFPRGYFYVKSLCNPEGELSSYVHQVVAMETETSEQGTYCGSVFRVASGGDIAGLQAATDIQAQ